MTESALRLHLHSKQLAFKADWMAFRTAAEAAHEQTHPVLCSDILADARRADTRACY